MNILKTVKQYKRKLEKRYSKQKRTQLNFSCDGKIVLALKVLARDLETPMYPLCEHLLQLGASEVVISMQNEGMREQLCRHLLQEHLLVPETELEPPSKNAARAQKAVDFLDLVERMAGDSEALTDIMSKMVKEAVKIGKEKHKIINQMTDG